MFYTDPKVLIGLSLVSFPGYWSKITHSIITLVFSTANEMTEGISA